MRNANKIDDSTIHCNYLALLNNQIFTLTEVVTDKLVSLLQDCGEAALGLVASNALDPNTVSARAVAPALHSTVATDSTTSSTTTNNSTTTTTTAAAAAATKPSGSTITSPLEELGTADICTVLERIGLKMLVDGFRIVLRGHQGPAVC